MVSEERRWESLKLSAWHASDMHCYNQQNKFLSEVFLKGLYINRFHLFITPGQWSLLNYIFLKARAT